MYRKIPDSGIDKKEILEYTTTFVSKLLVAAVFAFLIWTALVLIQDSSAPSGVPSVIGKAVSYNSTLDGTSATYLLTAIALTAAGAYAAINYPRYIKTKPQHRRLQDV